MAIALNPNVVALGKKFLHLTIADTSIAIIFIYP
jgi:hypothetical protein